MTITLTLNNRQVAMLHAIFGEATTQSIVNAVSNEYSNFLNDYPNDPICTAYKHTVAFMNNHPTYAPFGDDTTDLLEALDDAMRTIGRNLESKEDVPNA